jgi:chaperonin GroES
MSTIRPLGDRVFVEPVEETVEQKGGIYLPDTAREKPLKAKVISVGPGRRDENGKLIPMEVKVGEFVLTSKYGGTEIKIDDKAYKILSSSDILAVVE